jgi:WD40 repeat protein
MVLRGHTAWVTSASFSPDGRQIVTSSGDGTARLWETATGQTLSVIEGHTGAVFDAVFSPDGRSIVTTGQDGTALIYPLSSCETCAPLNTLIALAHSRVTRNLTPQERQEFSAG